MTLAPYTILDVSGWQGPTINWQLVAASKPKIDGVYIKATQGATGTDQDFARNWGEAGAAGMLRGAYLYFTSADPEQQAQHLLETLPPDIGAGPPMWPPMIDVESAKDPHVGMGAAVLKCAGVLEQALGMQPTIYSGPSFAMAHLATTPELARFQLLVAHYTSAPAPMLCPPWGRWGEDSHVIAWQYRDDARVPGISTPVDLSRAIILPGM